MTNANQFQRYKKIMGIDIPCWPQERLVARIDDEGVRVAVFTYHAPLLSLPMFLGSVELYDELWKRGYFGDLYVK